MTHRSKWMTDVMDELLMRNITSLGIGRRRRYYRELDDGMTVIKLECDQLVLFCGRLAEVISVGSFHGPVVLEVTDAGNITHTYTTPDRALVQPLQNEGECVLDAVRRATPAELTDQSKRTRMAEVWLADPRVGDVFQIERGQLLELTEIGEAGSIWTAITGLPHGADNRRVVTGAHFPGARTLRQFLSLKTRPVYAAMAIATLRPDYIGNHLLRPGKNSPLEPGDGNLQRKTS